jgi:cell division protein FtsA
MKKDGFVAVLDVGSDKFICTVGFNKNESIEILGLAECFSEGLDKGNIRSIEKASDSIQKVVEEVEAQTGKKIKELFVGIRGEHVETSKAKGIINITRTNKEITEEDKKQVLASVKSQISLSDDRDILEIIPIVYTVDNQTGILDPKGMEANHLQIDAYIVTASSVVLNNLYKCVNNAGFKISNICYNQIALSEICLVPEEKEVGVVLVDIGSKLTDISVYKNNRFFFNKEIALGGDLIVNDVAYGLKTSLTRARELIINHGLAFFPKDLEDKEIKFFGVDGLTERRITQYGLTEIINARVEEIFKIINKILLDNGIGYTIPSGLVITGGVAKLKYIQDVAKEMLNMPVRLGPSQEIFGREEIISNMSYTTALGLVKYFYKNNSNLFKMKKAGHNNFFSNIKKQLERIF